MQGPPETFKIAFLAIIDQANTKTNFWLKFAGLKFVGSRRVTHVLHVLCGLVFFACGLDQFVAGIYFMMNLPIFQIGSNIWTGAWVSCLD